MKRPCAFASPTPIFLNNAADSSNNNYSHSRNYNYRRRKHHNFHVTALARFAKRTIQRIPSDVPVVQRGESHIDVDKHLSKDPGDLGELLSALTEAGFSHISAPLPLELSPPYAQALPLRIRANENSLRPLVEHNDSIAPWKSLRTGDDAPATFIVSVRGVSDKRSSGLLFGSKIRSLEVAYQAPLASLRERILSFLSKRKSGDILRELLPAVPDETCANAELNIDTVRRVVPSGDIRDFFRPSCAIEPTYREVIMIYCPKKKESPRKKIADALQKAINPVTTNNNNIGQYRGPPLDDFRVEMYRDVPWGLLHHIFPSETQVVQPRARDLLRVDSLTLLGLVSTIITYFRDADSPFLNIVLAGTVMVYGFRIALGLQSAFSNYRARIIEHKFQFVVRKGSARDALSLIRNEPENIN